MCRGWRGRGWCSARVTSPADSPRRGNMDRTRAYSEAAVVNIFWPNAFDPQAGALADTCEVRVRIKGAVVNFFGSVCLCWQSAPCRPLRSEVGWAGMCLCRWRRHRHRSAHAPRDRSPLDAVNVQAMSPGHCLVEPEWRFSSGPKAQNEKAHRGGHFQFGAEGRNRTGTPLQARDFESRASTSSATPAIFWVNRRLRLHPFGRRRIIA